MRFACNGSWRALLTYEAATVQKGTDSFVTQAWLIFEEMASLLAVPTPSVQLCPVTCRRAFGQGPTEP